MKRKPKKRCLKNRQDKNSEKIFNAAKEENVRIYCIAYCNECKVDTLAEKRQVNCRVCSDRLVYSCAMCKNKFSDFEAVKDHVINGLEDMTPSIKCSKCFRSYFSTRCSLEAHERNCDPSFRFDKILFVKLEKCDLLTDSLKGKIIY